MNTELHHNLYCEGSGLEAVIYQGIARCSYGVCVIRLLISSSHVGTKGSWN